MAASHRIHPSHDVAKQNYEESPYDLIIGYTPRIESIKKPVLIPSVEEQLAEHDKIRQDTLVQIIKVQKVMKIGNLGNKKFWPYQKGDQVWVKGTNIRMVFSTVKLAPK